MLTFVFTLSLIAAADKPTLVHVLPLCVALLTDPHLEESSRLVAPGNLERPSVPGESAPRVGAPRDADVIDRVKALADQASVELSEIEFVREFDDLDQVEAYLASALGRAQTYQELLDANKPGLPRRQLWRNALVAATYPGLITLAQGLIVTTIAMRPERFVHYVALGVPFSILAIYHGWDLYKLTLLYLRAATAKEPRSVLRPTDEAYVRADQVLDLGTKGLDRVLWHPLTHRLGNLIRHPLRQSDSEVLRANSEELLARTLVDQPERGLSKLSDFQILALDLQRFADPDGGRHLRLHVRMLKAESYRSGPKRGRRLRDFDVEKASAAERGKPTGGLLPGFARDSVPTLREPIE